MQAVDNDINVSQAQQLTRGASGPRRSNLTVSKGEIVYDHLLESFKNDTGIAGGAKNGNLTSNWLSEAIYNQNKGKLTSLPTPKNKQSFLNLVSDGISNNVTSKPPKNIKVESGLKAALYKKSKISSVLKESSEKNFNRFSLVKYNEKFIGGASDFNSDFFEIFSNSPLGSGGDREVHQFGEIPGPGAQLFFYSDGNNAGGGPSMVAKAAPAATGGTDNSYVSGRGVDALTPDIIGAFSYLAPYVSVVDNSGASVIESTEVSTFLDLQYQSKSLKYSATEAMIAELVNRNPSFAQAFSDLSAYYTEAFNMTDDQIEMLREIAVILQSLKSALNPAGNSYSYSLPYDQIIMNANLSHSLDTIFYSPICLKLLAYDPGRINYVDSSATFASWAEQTMSLDGEFYSLTGTTLVAYLFNSIYFSLTSGYSCSLIKKLRPDYQRVNDVGGTVESTGPFYVITARDADLDELLVTLKNHFSIITGPLKLEYGTGSSSCTQVSLGLLDAYLPDSIDLYLGTLVHFISRDGIQGVANAYSNYSVTETLSQNVGTSDYSISIPFLAEGDIRWISSQSTSPYTNNLSAVSLAALPASPLAVHPFELASGGEKPYTAGYDYFLPALSQAIVEAAGLSLPGSNPDAILRLQNFSNEMVNNTTTAQINSQKMLYESDSSFATRENALLWSFILEGLSNWSYPLATGERDELEPLRVAIIKMAIEDSEIEIRLIKYIAGLAWSFDNWTSQLDSYNEFSDFATEHVGVDLTGRNFYNKATEEYLDLGYNLGGQSLTFEGQTIGALAADQEDFFNNLKTLTALVSAKAILDSNATSWSSVADADLGSDEEQPTIGQTHSAGISSVVMTANMTSRTPEGGERYNYLKTSSFETDELSLFTPWGAALVDVAAGDKTIFNYIISMYRDWMIKLTGNTYQIGQTHGALWGGSEYGHITLISKAVFRIFEEYTTVVWFQEPWGSTHQSPPNATEYYELSLVRVHWFKNEFFLWSFAWLWNIWDPSALATLGFSTPESNTYALSLHETAMSVYSTLVNEDLHITNSLYFLTQIAELLREASDGITGLVDLVNSDPKIASILQLFFTCSGGNPLDVLSVLTPDQIALMYASRRLLGNSSDNAYPHDISYLPAEKKVSQSQVFNLGQLVGGGYLPIFLGEEGSLRKRIFAIGLPIGIMGQLRDQGFALPDNYAASTLVRVTIYKRDLQRDFTRFKPKNFIFDISQFIFPENQNYPELADETTALDEISNRIIFTRVDGWTGVQTDQSYSQMMSSLRYGSMSNIQKNTLVQNHIVDYSLKTYLDLLSGIELEESNMQFTNNTFGFGSDYSSQGFFNVVIEYLAAMYSDINLQNRLEFTSLATEISRSTYFSTDKLVARTVSPKLFDRILCVLIDVEDFEQFEMSTAGITGTPEYSETAPGGSSTGGDEPGTEIDIQVEAEIVDHGRMPSDYLATRQQASYYNFFATITLLPRQDITQGDLQIDATGALGAVEDEDAQVFDATGDDDGYSYVGDWLEGLLQL